MKNNYLSKLIKKLDENHILENIKNIKSTNASSSKELVLMHTKMD